MFRAQNVRVLTIMTYTQTQFHVPGSSGSLATATKWEPKQNSRDVLMTNDCTILIIHFYPTVFLSALHVSNESSRSSSGARLNILYYVVWYNQYNRAGESSCLAARLSPHSVLLL